MKHHVPCFAAIGCLILLGSSVSAQQLPAPHAVGSTVVHHSGGLGGFSGGFLTAVASQDGSVFATNDGTVWSVSAGGVIGQLGKPLRVFALSAHGSWLAFAENNSIKVWTLASGEVRDLGQMNEMISHLASSPDETTLIAVPRNGAPELFQVASGMHLRNLVWSTEGYKHALNSEAPAAFSPDGRLVACGSEVWTVATGISLFHFTGTFEGFSSDGTSIFELLGHTVAEWKLASQERISAFDIPAGSSDRFIFRPDGRVAVLSQPLKPDQLTIWDLHAGIQAGVIHVRSINGGYKISFLGSSNWLIAGADHAAPRLILISTGEEIATLDSNGKNWSVVRTTDGAYDASPDALTIRPQQSGPAMSVDGVRINEGKFTRVPGLLSHLPGEPVAEASRPRPKKR